MHKLIKTGIPAAILVGALAVAGCGGGGGSKSASVPAPVKNQANGAGGVVNAEGTLGLTGPAERATSQKKQFSDATGKIPANANHKTNALKHGVAAGADCADGDTMPADDNIAQLNASILCLVNAERADNGNLPPLTANDQLGQAAAGMCQLMITEHFFAHETPEGKTVVDRVQPTGYIPKSGSDWVVGENLAWGSGGLSTPQAIVNGWMNSPGHRANILAPDYKDVGLAACNGSPLTTSTGGTVYVNDFGAKNGADVNATLPSESGSNSSSNTSAAAATVAGTKAVAAKKARAKHHVKKKARKHRRKKHS